MALVEFSVIPVDNNDASMKSTIVSVAEQIKESGIPYKITDTSTIIEGDMSDCLNLINNTMVKLSDNHQRIYCDIKIDYHKGKKNRINRQSAVIEDILSQ
ncbi:MAG: MTH1187 family thiamine-binding protein [Candidatus Kapaibacterium sp.]